MIGFGNSPTCEECDEWLTGRQTRFCSARCKMRARRRTGPKPAEKVCRLCGATFRPLRGKQTYCDFANDADESCAELQNALAQEVIAKESQRWDAECAREGCDDSTGWDGVGRPRRFCSDRCRVAHYRAEKRQAGA
ncbi:hypothetical protein [Streptomyces chartreusis]|uniref:hypothetical protein n=1 Tax=Streptomyces chartreusis TaxID=1969 RepID=UPI0036BFD1C9